MIEFASNEHPEGDNYAYHEKKALMDDMAKRLIQGERMLLDFRGPDRLKKANLFRELMAGRGLRVRISTIPDCRSFVFFVGECVPRRKRR